MDVMQGAAGMVRLDHLTLPVRDWRAARDWYIGNLGFELEFEIPDAATAAVKDSADLTIFLAEGVAPACPGLAFTIQVDDVEQTYERLRQTGVAFTHPPQKVFWGYGAELRDPDGYTLRLWDETSMREKG